MTLSRATLPAFVACGAIAASACVAQGQGQESSSNNGTEVGSTSAPIEGGDPINDGVNPYSTEFPMSTVGLTTPFVDSSGNQAYHFCTGVILSATQILTAAHCSVNSTTIVYFYRTARLGDGLDDQPDGSLTTTGLPGAAVLVPDGVTCNPDASLTGCFSTWGAAGPGTSTSHFADLAILTIKDPIALAAPGATSGYRPVLIGPSGGYASGQAADGGPPPTTWEVGTGHMNTFINACNASSTEANPLRKMSWVAVYGLSPSDSTPTNAAVDPALMLGTFLTEDAPFGDAGDSGGPIYQRAIVPVGTPPPYNLMVVGLLSLASKCKKTLPDGAVVSTLGDTHHNYYTSLEYPDNYAWVVQHGGVGASGVPTFGAAQP